MSSQGLRYLIFIMGILILSQVHSQCSQVVTDGAAWTSLAQMRQALHTAGVSRLQEEARRSWGLHTWGLFRHDDRGGDNGGRCGLLTLLRG